MHNYWLTSANLGFDHWTPADQPLAIGLWGDQAVTRYHAGPWSLEQVSQRLAYELDHRKQYGVQYWPVFLRETQEHVGCCGLHVSERSDEEWELGCYLRRAFWSKNLGREAPEAVIAHAFKALGAQAIRAGHHPANEASRKFLRHLGFRYTHDEFYPATGLMEPRYLLDHHIRSSGTVNPA